ncbi:MAG: AsmA family protein [Cohaesibacteraceae bacterium]|nr:AsmA family protein [Cohaesibacteraceae bacterium]
MNETTTLQFGIGHRELAAIMKRVLAYSGIAILLLLASIIAATPFLVSSDTLKQNVTDQLSLWTGSKVTFRGEPVIKLFPRFTVKLKDVKIASGNDDNIPLVRMNNLKADLNFFALLTGEVEVKRFIFAAPRFELSTDALGKSNWSLTGGFLGQEIKAAMSGNPVKNERFGQLDIFGGYVRHVDHRTGQSTEFSAIDLKLKWSDVAKPLTILGNFIWNGENIAIESKVSDVIALASGQSSQTVLQIRSTLIDAGFTGNFSLADKYQFDGRLTATTASFRQFLGWQGIDIEPGETMGFASISGEMNWYADKVSISQASVKLDDNSAEGVLSLDFEEDDKWSLQGTLAFDTIDLSSYSDFWIENTESDSANGIQNRVFLMDLDVRMSANRVVVRDFQSGSIAATVSSQGGVFKVSIGDYEVFEGNLSGEVSYNFNKIPVRSGVKLRLNKIQFAKILTFFGKIERVTGNLSGMIELTGDGPVLQDHLSNGQGIVDISIDAGTIDLTTFGDVFGAINEGKIPASAIWKDGKAKFGKVIAKLNFTADLFSFEQILVTLPDADVYLSGEVGRKTGIAILDGRFDTIENRDTSIDSPPASTLPFKLEGAIGKTLNFIPGILLPLPSEETGNGAAKN